jgi:hypothetical protein
VLGVVGDWGSGKTTVLRFAEYFINDMDFDAEVMWFNPWACVSGGQGAIQEALLAQVSAKVLSRLQRGKEKVRRVAKDYGKGAMQTAKLIPFAGEAAADIASTALARLPDNRKALISALTERGRPLVVFVDDVDRLTGVELLELFAALRVVVDLPHVQYVLAYDAESVAKALTAVTGMNGYEFLEKIVAVPVSVPRVPFDLLFRKLQTDLRGVFEREGLSVGIFKDWQMDLAQITRPWLRTPRDVVRFTNRVKTMAALAVMAELSPEDFLVCELLAVFTPRLSSEIGANKEVALLVQSPFEEIGSTNKGQLAAARAVAIFQPLLSDLAPPEQLAIMKALESTLPALHSTLSNKANYYGKPETGRLAHGAYFDRYFSYTAWADDVPDSEVASRWARVIDGQEFGPSFAELLADGSRYVLRDKLIKAIDDNPTNGERVSRLVVEMEQLAGTDAWLEAVEGAHLWEHRPVIVDLDVVAAHAIRLAYESAADGIAAVVEATRLPDFAFHTARALAVEYGVRDGDLKAFFAPLAEHVSSLLSRDGALERFRNRSGMLTEPARFAHFYAPNGFDSTAWSNAVDRDPSLLEVVLAVFDNVVDNANPDDRRPSATYVAEFVNLETASKAAQQVGRSSPRVDRYWSLFGG